MADLRELYQSVILAHNRAPRNFRDIAGASRRAEGNNPLCGDRLRVSVALDGEVIQDVAFVGSGCAISKASASLMTEAVKGKSVAEARGMFERFQEMVTGRLTPEDAKPALGKLTLFAGVSAFPVRVKCASLCWHALKAALEAEETVVSTE
jgi:nitrogen fixation protein NifU and related proteins